MCVGGGVRFIIQMLNIFIAHPHPFLSERAGGGGGGGREREEEEEEEEEAREIFLFI